MKILENDGRPFDNNSAVRKQYSVGKMSTNNFSANRRSSQFTCQMPKKLPKLFFSIISNFFFSKNFLYENFYYRIFFGENFSFHKNTSLKIFFTIFSRIYFVFDVCKILYFAEFFIRNFAYCDFFCFAILVYGKKNCTFFFCDFFFSDEREYQI